MGTGTQGEERVICSLRGAAQARNEADDIREQTAALYDRLLEANDLCEADIISLVFSVTKDLDALNPAAALRQTGRAPELAIMVLQEAEAVNSLPRTIRVLVHCYRKAGSASRHIYRNGAEVLRPDRAGGNNS